jgi:serine/threonine-protein kinase HipA
MRKMKIYRDGILAGILTEESRNSYIYLYDDTYFHDSSKEAVSLTLPMMKQEYRSGFLFPFFFNMLSEGANKKLQTTLLKIDENDHFGLLMATAQYDTIGAITVMPVAEE